MTSSAATAISRPSGRLPSLDGLRAISISLVLLGHGAASMGISQYVSAAGDLGLFGVRVFFIISGFLITTLLLNELDSTGRISMKQFYTRRTLRIFPAF